MKLSLNGFFCIPVVTEIKKKKQSNTSNTQIEHMCQHLSSQKPAYKNFNYQGACGPGGKFNINLVGFSEAAPWVMRRGWGGSTYE